LPDKLTWCAVELVDLSSDNVTVWLRPGPRGRTNDLEEINTEWYWFAGGRDFTWGGAFFDT
jgi:hypothetical protein